MERQPDTAGSIQESVGSMVGGDLARDLFTRISTPTGISTFKTMASLFRLLQCKLAIR